MSFVVHRRVRVIALAALSAVLTLLLTASPSHGHGFSSVVYAEVTSPQSGLVHAELALEYDLLVASAADAENDDLLFQAGTAAFESGDQAEQVAVLRTHSASVLKYLAERFTVSSGDEPCTPQLDGDATMTQREGVPYAVVALDFACAQQADSHTVASKLFPDSEKYVRDTVTIVTYNLDLTSGSAALKAGQTSFDTHQSTGERFWEFFKLGAEHLLGGLDHILFLLALIAGSRRLREVVLAATTFTVAHSVTLILAALGLVKVSGDIVEPIIAMSIAVVAGWHLWRIATRRSHASDMKTDGGGHLSLDRSGWIRLGVVFCFGLVHGLGFAGALGIDQPYSWTLLWSLLVFNIGIEAVQLGIIIAVFPLLALVRHRAPAAGLWVTGLLSAGVAAMGLIWFFQRVG